MDLNIATQTVVTNTYNLEMVKMTFPREKHKHINKAAGIPMAPKNG